MKNFEIHIFLRVMIELVTWTGAEADLEGKGKTIFKQA